MGLDAMSYKPIIMQAIQAGLGKSTHNFYLPHERLWEIIKEYNKSINPREVKRKNV